MANNLFIGRWNRPMGVLGPQQEIPIPGPAGTPGPQGPAGSFNVVTKTSNYTARPNDCVLCDTTAGGFTVTLPASSGNLDAQVMVKKISADANVVTISPSGGDTLQ